MKSVLLGLLLVGCVDVTEIRLADLADRRLSVGVTDDHYLVAELDFTPTGDQCPVLTSSFRAAVNDQSVDVVMNDYIDADTWCLFPPMQLSLPRQAKAYPDAVLELRDDSLTITAYLGDLFAPRTATLASTTLDFTQPLDVTWSPASDLGRLTPRPRLTQSHPDELGGGWRCDVLGIQGDTLTLALPSRDMLFAGPGTLMIAMTPDPSLPCTNAQCTLAASHHVNTGVTIQ